MGRSNRWGHLDAGCATMKGKTMFRTIPAVSVVLGLTACGSVYRSASVEAGIEDGTNVRVVKMNAETVVQANLSPYQPRTLPAIFSQTAGLGSTT